MGEIGFCEFAPAITDELAESVVKALHKKEAALADLAACVMAPWHGIFALAQTIDNAYNAVELIDNAAYIILMSSGLSPLSTNTTSWAERTALLKEDIAKYGKSAE
jgi:ribulose-5-phosphate 4-epimerase/fuculose-1-phosphate aldolase